ncbi:MAG: DUF3990 domain-containing protein [Roseburia sp.]|nr:DUF3990 domain-containing protein [Roseburia sp.]
MQNDRRDTCGKIIVYHGSPNAVVKPAYGLGEERHDYGRGFYTTESSELAKEWAVVCGNLYAFNGQKTHRWRNGGLLHDAGGRDIPYS